jgi:hypothetical protein
MNQPLNYRPDLGTLARAALARELLADGIPRRKVEKLVGALEIRVRRESPFGAFRMR